MKGFGTDEKALIRVLGSLGPLEINGVKAAFHSQHRRDLVKDVHGETSGHFREGLEAILRGPLEQDCYAVHESIKGLGTKESAMNDVLLSRTNADLNAIKVHYQHMYRKSLESDVKGDLSMKTERLFDMVMAARRNEESAPIIPQQIDADINELYHATEGKKGTDELTVCSILSSRSNGQIRAIAHGYHQKYHRSLEEVIKSEFSGHMVSTFPESSRFPLSERPHLTILHETARRPPLHGLQCLRPRQTRRRPPRRRHARPRHQRPSAHPPRSLHPLVARPPPPSQIRLPPLLQARARGPYQGGDERRL